MPSVKLAAGERRSLNEVQFEAELKRRGIKYSYEPETFTLMPTQPGTDGRIPAITYTPDYRLEINGKILWIEVKGFARGADLLINRLADWYFTVKRKEAYLMVSQFGSWETGTKSWYRYSQKAAVSNIKRGILEKTIHWDKDNTKLKDLWTWLEEYSKK